VEQKRTGKITQEKNFLIVICA